jgi:predicted CXXCH cytochrome family protein
MKPSHHPILEGKVKCSDCHNPHGALTHAMLKHETVNQQCYSCHADKRGPFVFSHPPVEENCITCHTPHGSSHEKLLADKAPNLCQDCHVTGRHPTTSTARGSRGSSPTARRTRRPNTRFIARGCLNCHNQIHGSNAPRRTRPSVHPVGGRHEPQLPEPPGCKPLRRARGAGARATRSGFPAASGRRHGDRRRRAGRREAARVPRPSDGLLTTIDVKGRNTRWWLDLFGENFGRDDQYINLRGGMYDVFKYRLYSDALKHNFMFFGITPYTARNGRQRTPSRA